MALEAQPESDVREPRLDRWFRSTDPKVLFVGLASEHRFGPIVRFIPGTRFSGPRVEELLTRCGDAHVRGAARESDVRRRTGPIPST